MKVLFLDIDGVVNNQENFNPVHGRVTYPIDRYCAFLVGKIQIHTDCVVVLSSSWRSHPDGIAEVEKHIIPIYDKTPEIFKSLETPIVARGREWTHSLRGDEINAWLAEHPEVEKYAILDDDSDFYDDQPLFQTTFKDGLTDEIAQKVIEYLNDV